MTNRQTNRLMMYRTVSAYLDANAEKMKNIPALLEVAGKLKELLGSLDGIAVRQASISKGKTDVKIEAEELLIENLNSVRCALYALGRKNGKAELKAHAEPSESRLRRMRDIELIRTAGILQKEASAYTADLVGFGITADEIAELAASIEAYARTMESRDTSVAERTGARVDLASIFSDAEELLCEDVDTLMELFRVRDEEFYNGYTAARVVRNLGVRRRNGGAEEVSEEKPAGVEAPALVSG